MSHVISLSEFKNRKRRLFLEHNKSFIDDYIRSFLANNCFLSYDVLRQQYMTTMQYQNEQAWDYLDFRDTLTEVVSEVIGEQLWQDIKRQSWFQPNLMGKDQIIDRLTSLFILGAAVSGMEG